MIEIVISLTLINLNIMAWAIFWKRARNVLKSATIDEEEKDRESIEKEKLAKEWANMMNYNGMFQGGE